MLLLVGEFGDVENQEWERERGGVWGGHQIRSSTSGQRPNNGEATVALAPEPRPTGYLPPIPFLAVFVVRAIS